MCMAPGLVVSEMVASGELAKGRLELDRRIRRPDIPVHMVQLAGREAAHMAEAARIAAGEGADIIDINMGCPAKKVTGGYAGSALMREPDHALSLIEAVIGAVDVPVTVKMRLGWDESALNAPLLARRAEQAGVRMVTVHGRTRCQFYQGKADWRAIAQGKAGGIDPGRRQWRRDLCGRCGAYARTVRRRRGNGRPRQLRRAMDGGRNCCQSAGGAAARGMPGKRRKKSPTMWSTITRRCCRSTGSKAGCGRRASISAGISTVTRRRSRPSCRKAIMTGLEPRSVIAELRQAFLAVKRRLQLRNVA